VAIVVISKGLPNLKYVGINCGQLVSPQPLVDFIRAGKLSSLRGLQLLRNDLVDEIVSAVVSK